LTLKAAGRLASYIPLLLIASVGGAVSLSAYLAARTWEHARVDAQFERRAHGLTAAVEKGLASNLEVLHSIRALFEVSPDTGAQGFRDFVQGFLVRNSTIQALSWNPRVLDAERARYEALGRQGVAPGFQITELGAGGALVGARTRAEYVPVGYIEPRRGNESALGFDVLSDPVRREAIERAQRLDRPAATARIRLVQERGGQWGFLILMPVRGGAGIRGFAVGVFRVGDMVIASLRGLDVGGIEFGAADETGPSPEPVLELPGSAAGRRQASAARFGWRTTLDVAGRRWSLSFFPTPEYLAEHRAWLDWAALALGLSITAIVMAYVHGASRRAAALTESEERFRSAFAHAAIGMALTGLDGRFSKANGAFCRITGYSEAELRATDFTALTHPDDLPENMRLFGRLLAGEIPGFVHEKRYLTRDGGIVWVQNSVSLARDERGQPAGMVALIQDVTERKRAEVSLRLLSRRLLDIQETERRRLAHELHDEIGQALSALKLNLDRMSARRVAPGDGTLLDDSIGIVERLAQQARSLALDLRPSLLDDFGLIPAVKWYVKKHAERSGLETEIVDKVAGGRLPKEVETACFRVIQEAVTNVVRHARARRVTIELAAGDTEVSLSVTDDGDGFDVAAARTTASLGGSFGIVGMEERVSLAGGRFELDSTRGQGTVVRARLPLGAPPPPGEVSEA
jgi:PAS domain S-box-containing protein